MLEETIRTEIRATCIYQLGLDAWHPPDLKKNLQKKVGRPDLITLGGNVVIEVKRTTRPKNEEPSIALSDISDPQRRWLDWWEIRGKKGNEIGLHFYREPYIAIGTQTPYKAPKRHLFVIPWLEWAMWEKTLTDGESVRVYLSQLYQFFSDYEWTWLEPKWNNCRWECPEYHPLFNNYFSIPTLEDDWKKQISLRFGVEEDNS